MNTSRSIRVAGRAATTAVEEPGTHEEAADEPLRKSIIMISEYLCVIRK